MRAITRREFDAVLFDLDGVVTNTDRQHALAWQQMLDEYLQERARRRGEPFVAFDAPADYLAFVDGKPREDGVRDFLASRSIVLPDGAPEDEPGAESVHGLARRKDDLVSRLFDDEGVEVYPGVLRWIEALRTQGFSTAVVSSSRHCAEVLASAGIAHLFDVQVDGLVLDELGLAGKPAPDPYVEAVRRLGVSPSRSVVVEDTRAGVTSARRGHIGYTIGVSRKGDYAQLVAAGADAVVEDLGPFTSLTVRGEGVGPKRHRGLLAAQRAAAFYHDFQVDEFRLVERRLNVEGVPQTESLFALANGYLGIRGVFEEGEPVYQPGTLLNGFYETWPIVYGEEAYGFAKVGQTILNVTDATGIKLYVDDERFDPPRDEVLEFERALDLRDGVLRRQVLWRTPSGNRVRVTSERLVSVEHRHLAAQRYQVEVLDAPATVAVSSELSTPRGLDGGARGDPRASRGFEHDVLVPVPHERPAANEVASPGEVMALRTAASGLTMACGTLHDLTSSVPVSEQHERASTGARSVFTAELEPGVPLVLVKYAAYHHGAVATDELCFRVRQTLHTGRREGFEGLVDHQRTALDAFWDLADVRIEGAPGIQQAVRFNLFQLFQATARAEGYGVPAKGLTGQGYEGHYFWDGEIYVLPFLVSTAPHLARSMLLHRYRMLDKARERAAELGHRGALFPWRTISGDEASSYYAAGTAQYHINADIAYGLMRYVRVTGDHELLARFGAEMLVETARFWVDLGFFSERKGGAFVINGVTGPDEYSTVVDNNAYTNLMARTNLLAAVEVVAWLRERDPRAFERLVVRTGFRDVEAADWQRAADLMYVPFDEQAGVHLQDDGFLDREVWDFAGTPADQYPLLLHFHPLVIYRHQVVKQADVVLATFLLGDQFTADEKRRIFDYYDPLTTGDSSLSESIQSIMATEVGDHSAAYSYFADAVALDLLDTAGNVRDGVHIASCGGTWLALVHGFGGLRDRDGVVRFRPVLPVEWDRLTFRVQTRGQVLEVDIEPTTVTYRLVRGEQLELEHRGRRVTVVAGDPVTVADAEIRPGVAPELRSLDPQPLGPGSPAGAGVAAGPR